MVAGSVQDVYSPRREDISALAAVDAQHSWIVIAGIIALGLGLIALGLGFLGVIHGGRSTTVGPILLVLAACVSRERGWHATTAVQSCRRVRSECSLLTGAVTLALLLVFGAELSDGWNGLVQRVLILVPLVWIAVLGTHLLEIATAQRLLTRDDRSSRDQQSVM